MEVKQQKDGDGTDIRQKITGPHPTARALTYVL
jgi:hypothetical protein